MKVWVVVHHAFGEGCESPEAVFSTKDSAAAFAVAKRAACKQYVGDWRVFEYEVDSTAPVGESDEVGVEIDLSLGSDPVP